MDISLVGLLTNFGLGGLVIMLIITGFLVPKPTHEKLEKENERLIAALEIERNRNTELAGTTGTTARLIGALTDIAIERGAARRDEAPELIRDAVERGRQSPAGSGS